MTQFLFIAASVFVACTFAALVVAFRCMKDLQNDLAYEREQRDKLRDDFREHYWDMHRAVAALGLKKMPSKGPEWVKEQP